MRITGDGAHPVSGQTDAGRCLGDGHVGLGAVVAGEAGVVAVEVGAVAGAAPGEEPGAGRGQGEHVGHGAAAGQHAARTVGEARQVGEHAYGAAFQVHQGVLAHPTGRVDGAGQQFGDDSGRCGRRVDPDEEREVSVSGRAGRDLVAHEVQYLADLSALASEVSLTQPGPYLRRQWTSDRALGQFTEVAGDPLRRRHEFVPLHLRMDRGWFRRQARCAGCIGPRGGMVVHAVGHGGAWGRSSSQAPWSAKRGP